MERYKKKPVIVEAVQFNGLNPTEIKDFVGENCKVEIYDNGITPPIAHIVIHTLEGDMEVSNGDYIIKGVKGEFYPCKPDIFEQTYESAETQKELEEVDLEKEMDRFYGMYRDKIGKTYAVEDDEPCFDWKEDELSAAHDIYVARHFYKLGRKQVLQEIYDGKTKPVDKITAAWLDD